MILIENITVGGINRRAIRKTTAEEVETLEAVKLKYSNFYSLRPQDGYVEPEE